MASEAREHLVAADGSHTAATHAGSCWQASAQASSLVPLSVGTTMRELPNLARVALVPLYQLESLH